MALRLTEGFDWTIAASDLSRKWDSGSTQTGFLDNAHARYGTGNGYRSFGFSEPFVKTLDSQGTWVVAFAMYPVTTSGTFQLVYFDDSGTTQCSLYAVNDTLEIRRGTGTTLATSAIVLTANLWYFVEVKVIIGDAGSMDVHVAGSSVVSVSATDVQTTANATADRIQIFGHGNSSNRGWLDDIYILDGTGAVNNDFLGDVRVETVFPSGNGNSSQFTGSDGNSTDNYLLVDDTDPDDESTYVQSTTLNHIDLYGMGDLSSTPSAIHAAVVNMHARKTDVDTRVLTEKVRSGATNYSGSTMSLAATYRVGQSIRETDPATAAAWTTSGVNAMEAGFEVTT